MNLRNRIAALEGGAARAINVGRHVLAAMTRLLSDPAAVGVANELARRMNHPGEPAPVWADPRLVAMSDAEMEGRLAESLEDKR